MKWEHNESVGWVNEPFSSVGIKKKKKIENILKIYSKWYGTNRHVAFQVDFFEDYGSISTLMSSAEFHLPISWFPQTFHWFLNIPN